MQTTRILAAAALGLSGLTTSTALAQSDTGAVPVEYASLPSEYVAPVASVDSSGIETITRTRWIEGSEVVGPLHQAGEAYYTPYAYPVRFDRDTWLAECYARSDLAGSKKKRRAARSYCDTALDRYMRSASYPVSHVAMRSIPADYGYGYAPMHAAGCGCSGPETMIEVPEEVAQHVIVRENVREEWIDVPAPREPAERIIEEPTKLQPIKSSPKMIKGS